MQCYSLQPDEVKRIVEAKYQWETGSASWYEFWAGADNRVKPYKEDQWLYYHLHRNFFNVKSEIKTLKKIGNREYRDNLGRIWTEISTFKNLYHMPLSNYIGSQIPLVGSTPYSRKFLSPDDRSDGAGGEFEMIIRNDGRRITSDVNAEYQETYNYGRTNDGTNRHAILDVYSHQANPNYTYHAKNGSVTISER